MMIKKKAGLRNYSNLSSAQQFYAVEKYGSCRKEGQRTHQKEVLRNWVLYMLEVV